MNKFEVKIIKKEDFARLPEWEESDFRSFTRIKFDPILPQRCQECGGKEDLQIHHIHYRSPIRLKDLVRLCRRCHVLEHQRVKPNWDVNPESKCLMKKVKEAQKS